MRSTVRWRRMAVVVLALGIGLAACTGASENFDMVGGDDSADRGEPAQGQAGRAEEDATEAAGDGEAGGTAAGGQDTRVEVGGDTAGRHVIREAHVTLASNDPEATVEAIDQAAVAAGGFVSERDLQREGGFLTGTVTVRVPAEQLSQTLTRIEAAGAEVTSQQLSSEDVTGEVTDVESQLRNLRALETQLLELLAEARDTGETEQVLRVFDRMEQARGQIERLQGRRAALADLVSLATITVRVQPTPDLLAQTAPERDPEPEPWSPARQVEVAWQATVTALRTIANVAIVLVVTVLPVLLVWAVPIALAVLGWRALRRRGGGPPGPSAERPAPPAPAPAEASVGSSQPDRD